MWKVTLKTVTPVKAGNLNVGINSERDYYVQTDEMEKLTRLAIEAGYSIAVVPCGVSTAESAMESFKHTIRVDIDLF